MIDQKKSYRRILKSTSITGGATVVNILVGVIRTKVVAVLLGPAGVGILGLYQSFISTASTFSGVGIATAASREIAELNGGHEEDGLRETIEALLIGTVILAVISGLVIWLFRDMLAMQVLGNIEAGNEIGWLGLAVSFAVVSASLVAIIQGMRQIEKLAKLNILSGIVATLVGIFILWKYRESGLVAFALAGPICSVFLGFYALRRNCNVAISGLNIHRLFHKFKVMGKLGFTLFFYAALEQVTFLFIRGNIKSSLGVDALGYFQAGYTIAVMYLGVITGAMASDFMPRIAESIRDSRGINKIINHQTEIGLLIGAPIIILMIGYAPIIINVMYSKSFIASVDIMRLLLLSDILKLISWPVGIALIGMGDGAAFARQGPVQLAIFYMGIILLIPIVGVLSVGYMMILIQAIGAVWGFYYLYRKTGYILEKSIRKYASIAGLIIIVTYCICITNELIGMIFSGVLAILFSLYSYHSLKLRTK